MGWIGENLLYHICAALFFFEHEDFLPRKATPRLKGQAQSDYSASDYQYIRCSRCHYLYFR